MGKTEEVKVNITSRATHRGVERSMTLNRRYVKRPTKLIIEKETTPRVEFHKNRAITVTADEISAIRKRSKLATSVLKFLEQTSLRQLLWPSRKNQP